MKQHNCSTCVQRISLPKSSNIGCNDPGPVEKECWPGCGTYPLSFNEHSIKSCERWSDDPADTKPVGNVAAVMNEIGMRLIDEHFTIGTGVKANAGFSKRDHRRFSGPRGGARFAR